MILNNYSIIQLLITAKEVEYNLSRQYINPRSIDLLLVICAEYKCLSMVIAWWPCLPTERMEWLILTQFFSPKVLFFSPREDMHSIYAVGFYSKNYCNNDKYDQIWLDNTASQAALELEPNQ